MTSALRETDSRPRSLTESNKKLQEERAAHAATRRELEAVRRQLENRIEERTQELSLLKMRFETALHGAKLYFFSQDRDLRYTWVYSQSGKDGASALTGRSDYDVLPPPERDAIITVKKQVLETGIPADCETHVVVPPARGLFALHVEAIFGDGDRVDGIMCTAIDVSRIRTLETEQRELTMQLAATLQRYETALRGSNVTIYTQDRDLRYTSLSKPLFGLSVADMLGRTDAEILPGRSEGLTALKRQVLAEEKAGKREFDIEDRTGTHWYSFHVEPLRDVSGAVIGLTCAAIDLTDQKEGERHLRLLMRELTHRSKNLLAVIQAMARQTARYSEKPADFLERFSARLQALSRSHDLLVQQSWHSVLLDDLIRSQLAHYLSAERSQIAIAGPAVWLKPEAAQSLGLAFHELATNAAKHGALSVSEGSAAIAWRPGAGGEVTIEWGEKDGPLVKQERARGFGSLVIEDNLTRGLGADVVLDFAPQGLRCRIIVPASHIDGMQDFAAGGTGTAASAL